MKKLAVLALVVFIAACSESPTESPQLAPASLSLDEIEADVSPAYVAIGASYEFGNGDDISEDGFGYVPIVSNFLITFYGQPVETSNFGVPGATSREILMQVSDAIAAAQGAAPVVVSWAGGANDLSDVASTAQMATCGQMQSCLGRVAAALNLVEVWITDTIAQLRLSLGPDAIILMMTHPNTGLRTGCATVEEAAIFTAALEGVPGTVLSRGLNNRIRDIAATYGAEVVDIFLPFALYPDTYVAADCAHPNGAGYALIGDLEIAAFLAAQ